MCKQFDPDAPRYYVLFPPDPGDPMGYVIEDLLSRNPTRPGNVCLRLEDNSGTTCIGTGPEMCDVPGFLIGHHHTSRSKLSFFAVENPLYLDFGNHATTVPYEEIKRYLGPNHPFMSSINQRQEQHFLVVENDSVTVVV